MFKYFVCSNKVGVPLLEDVHTLKRKLEGGLGILNHKEANVNDKWEPPFTMNSPLGVVSDEAGVCPSKHQARNKQVSPFKTYYWII